MKLERKVYDISVMLGTESIVYPRDTAYEREDVWSIARGDPATLSKLIMSAHSGTHLDAPAHFVKGGKRVDDYCAGDFIMPAIVVESSEEKSIMPSDLADVEIEKGDAVLFKTNNSKTGLCKSGKFSTDFVDLSLAAAKVCVEKGASLIGIDYVTIEQKGDRTFPVHHLLLGNEIPILEGINLESVAPGRYTLICLPLKMKKAEASPVRAVLVREK